MGDAVLVGWIVLFALNAVSAAVNLWQAANGYNMPRSLQAGLLGLLADLVLLISVAGK